VTSEHDLIYGKASVDRIVNIEVTDDVAEIYRELEDGSINVTVVPNKFWILANQQLDRNFVRLKGDLHYKWGRQFSERKQFSQFRYFTKQRDEDIFSVYDAKEALMLKDGYTYYKNMRPQDVSILSFDIETTSLDPNIPEATVLLISNTLRKNGKIEKKLFSFEDSGSAGQMIEDWCDWVRKVNPAIICGHNIFSFDLPYLNSIAEKCEVELKLGRNGNIVKFDKFESQKRIDQTRDQNYKRSHIYGREIIDTMFLAIDYDISKKYESYALKKIIAQEGLEKKDRVFYDAAKIRVNYKDPVEWTKIKEYCKDDADDALALFDLMSAPFFYMTQSVPKSFELMIQSATGSKINSVMMRAYLQQGHSLPKTNPVVAYQGAISLGKENAGVFNNVWKVDVASLYPSIMIEYEVCDKAKDPNEYFKTLVRVFTEKRLEYKKKAKEDKYYDDLQAAFKIFINSAYGFLGTQGLSFNSPSNASFITEKGREILNKAIAWAADQNLQLVNADTDSISVTEKDGSYISVDKRKALLQSLCSLYPSRISWEDDGYYTKVITVGTKNYILKKEDGKVTIKGSALKGKTREPALNEFMNKMIDKLLNNDTNYLSLYYEYVKEILQIKDITRWVMRKSISENTIKSTRLNETKIIDAIKGTEYREGDRVYMFFKSDDTLCLLEKYDGDYSRERFLEKLYNTVEILHLVIDVNQFPDLSLAKKTIMKRYHIDLDNFTL